MSSVGLTSLARCVDDVDSFMSGCWGIRTFVRRGTDGFEDLLDVAAIEVLLTDLGRRPTFRVVRDGTPVGVDDYTMRTRVGGATIDGVADIDRILELVA